MQFPNKVIYLLVLLMLGAVFIYVILHSKQDIRKINDLSKIILYVKNRKITETTSPLILDFFENYCNTCRCTRSDKKKIDLSYSILKESVQSDISQYHERRDLTMFLMKIQSLCRYGRLIDKDYEQFQLEIVELLTGPIYESILSEEDILKRYQLKVRHLLSFLECSKGVMDTDTALHEADSLTSTIEKEKLDNYTKIQYGRALLKLYDLNKDEDIKRKIDRILDRYVLSHIKNKCFSLSPTDMPHPVYSYVSLLFLKEYSETFPQNSTKILKVMKDCIDVIPRYWQDDGGIFEYNFDPKTGKYVKSKAISTNVGFANAILYLHKRGVINLDIC